jgi:FkbM family methyltransferase
MKDTNMTLVAGTIETNLIQRYKSKSGIVFDIGAHLGNWTEEVLKRNPKSVHLFEPIEECVNILNTKYQDLIRKGVIFVSHVAVSNKIGEELFYYYPKHPTLSSVYRRIDGEKRYNLSEPAPPYFVPSITLDVYCSENNIVHIDYLKIDVEGAELDVIQGCTALLTEQRISYLEFEYGGTYIDSNKKLKDVYDFLISKGYNVFKASSSKCEKIMWNTGYENFEFSIFIATLPEFSISLEENIV